GTIDASHWHDEWWLQVSAGATVDISMTTTVGNLNPFVIVLSGRTGNWVIGKRTFAHGKTTFTFVPPEDGVYVVTATRSRLYNGNTVGDYTLLITGQEPGAN